MKKLLLFILFITFNAQAGWYYGAVESGGAPTYIVNLPCSDNAANTTVTNDGTGSDWVSGVNTSIIASSGAFNLSNTTNHYIKSPSNWTSEKFEVTFDYTPTNATAANAELIWSIGDGSTSTNTSSMLIRRANADARLWIEIQGSSDSWTQRYTTNYTADTNTDTMKVTVDASTSPWVVTVYQDETLLTWNGVISVAEGATFNQPMNFGGIAYHPTAVIDNVTVEDLE